MISTEAKDMAGNALTASKTWTFTTGAVADIAANTINFTVPADGATGVAINPDIAAMFSEPMDAASITGVTFTLTQQGGSAVPGDISYIGTYPHAHFFLTRTLDANTLYTATLNTGVKDSAGNPLLSNKTWSFTTGSVQDKTAPGVIATFPLTSATGVAVDANITATFDEAMDGTTIIPPNFTLMQGASSVPGVVTYLDNTATFNPDINLAAGTLYSATIGTGAMDTSFNALTSKKVWNFTTAP